MKKHLNICIQTEETVGKIYRTMLASPRLSSAAQEVFQELAEDENDHANQLRLALRFPENSVLDSLPDSIVAAQKMLTDAKRILEKVKQIEVDDQLAISIGIELEKKFCQVHIANSFEFKEEKFREMFAAMAKEDERHCQVLRDLQSTISQQA